MQRRTAQDGTINYSMMQYVAVQDARVTRTALAGKRDDNDGLCSHLGVLVYLLGPWARPGRTLMYIPIEVAILVVCYT
jgi:hypothetical protein